MWLSAGSPSMAVLLGLSSMSPEHALSWRLCLASMAASASTAAIASNVMTPSATSPAGCQECCLMQDCTRMYMC